jgi:hypothetical protein
MFSCFRSKPKNRVQSSFESGLARIPKTSSLKRLLTSLSIVVLVGAGSTLADEIRFARDIRPILNENCLACHGGVKQASKLSLIYRDKVLLPAKSGKTPIVPGDAGKSELMRRVTSTDLEDRMPPPDHGAALDAESIRLLTQWINEGAVWEEHWAFVPPREPESPNLAGSHAQEWPNSGMDAFVYQQMELHGLSPAPEADRLQWLRRVSFDLTGLPPTPEEIKDFINDTCEGAHERVVDRLLKSESYGERWAALWLDLARYADSQGYEKDGERLIWPYRDWLIRALNEDMPYDAFTHRQLAGDLIPGATMEDWIATGFHRNTPTNTEGGTDDEEFRISAVLDRVSSTWKVWQGVSFNCVQCHSHPYDPIEHQEFYKFYSFFNTSKDWDLRSDEPKLSVPKDSNDFSKAVELDTAMQALRSQRVRKTREMVRATQGWKSMEPAFYDSDKLTQLVLKQAATGEYELWTEGTVSHDSRFILEFPSPEISGPITALRIDALPKDVEKALYTPELGFAITHIEARVMTHADRLLEAELALDETLRREKGEEKDPTAAAVDPGTPVRFKIAFGDDSNPFDWPEETLKSGNRGWGANPRISHQRTLVLVPETPIDFSSWESDTRLRLVLDHRAAPNDLAQLVMNRSRYLVTDDPVWTQRVESDAFAAEQERWKDLNEQRREIPSIQTLVMQEQDSVVKREAAVFIRGSWLNKGEAVQPGIPKIFQVGGTRNPSDRLELAQWLTSRQNPLTARVAVNRIWHSLFGQGIVTTLEDFGSSGAKPTHPELLDYLAVQFQTDLGWSMKGLLREIVLSATYRQDSRGTTESRKLDPGNQWLARGPRLRLTAEMVRDNALQVSGLLSQEMYGPPVMPWQPDGIWNAARSSMKWKISEDGDQYRRAIYTYWRRSNPYPSMILFDTPNRLVCSARRTPTNTPLQALVTLNDPVYMECASHLADQLIGSAGGQSEAPESESNSESESDSEFKIETALDQGFRLVTGKTPEPEDIEDLHQLYLAALEHYQSDPDESAKVAATPEIASLTLVANALLNLDMVLSK